MVKIFCDLVKQRVFRILTALIFSITLLVSCAPQQKPVDPSPSLPPNTNRAPMWRNPQRMARGLAGTAQQTPGVRRAWGVGYENTVLLGVTLDSGLSPIEADQTKIAAVNRALRSTTQLVVIKITDETTQVRSIQSLQEQLQNGAKIQSITDELKALDDQIPAVDPVRPR